MVLHEAGAGVVGPGASLAGGIPLHAGCATGIVVWNSSSTRAISWR